MSAPASLAKRVALQSGYETTSMLRNGEQLVLAIVLPLLALIGLTVTPLLDPLVLDRAGAGRVDIAAPGVLALCAMSTAFTGQGIATGFDRRYGVLRFLSTTPLGRTGLIAGKAVAVMAVLALQVLVIGTVAGFLGWNPDPTGIPAAVLLLILGAAAFTALGLLVAGTVRPEATLAITNLLWILLAAGGGIVIPAAALPDQLAGVVQLLPSGALGDALRDALLAGQFNLFAFLVLAAWTLAAGTAAARWFKWS